MPRTARNKNSYAMYHIICRGISDVNLYRNGEDKEKYLKVVKRYQKVYGFKVLTYCFMDTHCHFIIDSNGADISKIFHDINQVYAQHYYNKKYKRRGPLFAGRFKSKIIYDNRYLVTVSLYIHKNPHDIKKYKKRLEEYKYSSLGVFLGLRRDKLKILEIDSIMNMFGKDINEARKRYYDVLNSNNEGNRASQVEFKDKKNSQEYKSNRKIIIRNKSPKKVVEYVAKIIGKDPLEIHRKYSRQSLNLRAISIYLMKYFCNLTYEDICKYIGNITSSAVSYLANKGENLIDSKEEYKKIVENFAKQYEQGTALV